ncbi:MAG: hypothetical protein M3O70_25910 [Actinomycetota bacterium]|nr:hypothetical protein [Actinomycetota bacterium]
MGNSTQRVGWATWWAYWALLRRLERAERANRRLLHEKWYKPYLDCV